MNMIGMAMREIGHRPGHFVFGVLAVAIASGTLMGATAVLRVQDIRTEQILQQKEEEFRKAMAVLQDDMRKATLKLGFNLLILPKDQNLSDFYADDFAVKYMPEEYVDRLVNSGTVLVQHILPTLQQKVEWPEKKRTIILVGTRGEVPKQYQDPRKPLVQPVPEGKIVLGHELHQSLGIKAGDKVTLMGREFAVHRCHEERGNKDDITAWVHLKAAQEMLDKKGVINTILALECLCAIGTEGKVREEVMQILPGVQVMEMGTKVLARAESRLKAQKEAREALQRVADNRKSLRARREDFAWIAGMLVAFACLVWIFLLSLQNVTRRRGEVGILRAMGIRSGQILALFVSRAIWIGVIGGAIGAGAGFVAGWRLGISLEAASGAAVRVRDLFDWPMLLAALVAGVVLTITATWVPAVMAARRDPAAAFREKI